MTDFAKDNGFNEFVRDMQFRAGLLQGQQPCPEGDHENVLPCPHCKAAV